MLSSLLALAISASLLSGQEGAAAVGKTPRPWTFMVYAAADNNADGPVLEFMDRVRKALDDDPGVELVLFIDRSSGYSNDASLLGEDFAGGRVYRIRKDSSELLDARSFFPGMDPGADTEMDSGDVRNIGRFISFCKERFPAERYGLMIYSHADGRGMCPDDESGSEMGIPELTEWVGEEASVDFMALELCAMGGLEIAYQWRPGNGGFSTEVLVAIPNTGSPMDWDRAFARIRTPGHATTATGEVLDPGSLTPADFGSLIVEEGLAGRRATIEWVKRERPEEAAALLAERNDILKEAGSSYDLRRVEQAKQTVDRLAALLAEEGGAREIVIELRGSTEEDRVLHYARKGDFAKRPYVDAYELFDRIAACKELSEEVRGAAREARDAVDALILQSFGVEEGWPGFQADRNGIFIVFPGPGTWGSFDWYSPVGPEDGGNRLGGWDFLADGATPGDGQVDNWFELLDCWFDDDSVQAGGLNGYTW